MSIRGKLIIIFVIFLIGIGALYVSFRPHDLTVTGKLTLLPHPSTGPYVPTMLVWTLVTDNQTYYLLDNQKRILGYSEDGAFSQYLNQEITVEGYNITFESYDSTITYDGLTIKKINGVEWSG